MVWGKNPCSITFVCLPPFLFTNLFNVLVLVLFDVRIYMMPHYNVPDSMTYHRQLPLLPKHTRPNRWWGFFLDLLTMISHIIYIMQTGSKPGHYIPLPLGITPSSVFHYIYTIHIQLHIKIPKLCRSVPRSIIYSERSRPSPSASMDFPFWFSASS